MSRAPRLARLLAIAALLALGAARPAGAPGPAIVFVSRDGLSGRTPAIPGLGPAQGAGVTRGRLMERGAGGALTEIRGPFRDASDPAVSPRADRVAFAAAADSASGWRLWLWTRRSGEVAPLPVPAAGASGRYDDLDPCWLDDSTLVFASSRDRQRSQYDGSAVTQLFRFRLGERSLIRLTAERNGAADPCVDPRSGRIVYSRWWFNRWRPAAGAAGSVTLDPSASIDPDTINLWQAISIAGDGTGARALSNAAGDRRLSALAQPAVAADGSLFGVVGDALGMSPASGATEVTWRSRPGAPPRHVAGARFDPADAPRYGSARGLASPSACAPAPLADGRVLLSLDPGGRGDFGVWVMNRDGGGAISLVDLPGTLELDAAPLVARALPRVRSAAFDLEPEPHSPAELEARVQTFRFFDRDVLGAGFGRREAEAARAAGPLRIRFWAALPRPEAPGGDTLVLVREAPIAANGRVDQPGLPAGVPMFEQLVDARGAVLRSAHGAAHVAGFNVGLPGTTSRCAGCHRGHSTAR